MQVSLRAQAWGPRFLGLSSHAGHGKLRVYSLLQFAKELAFARHCQLPVPLVQDPYAAALSDEHRIGATEAKTAATITAALDTELLQALQNVNVGRKQEFRQVVLLGCGLDTRPQRLLWPEGTLIFEVAEPEVHSFGADRLKAAGARVPRGCLLRRISHDLRGDESLLEALERSGYRADRLSIWLLQGLPARRFSAKQIQNILTQISIAAAFESILLLELPVVDRTLIQSLLAEHRMEGRVFRPLGLEDLAAEDKSTELVRRDSIGWLASCHHRQLSLTEIDTLNAHTQALEDTDEDFFDNFS